MAAMFEQDTYAGLIQKLIGLHALDDAEVAALRQLPLRPQIAHAGTTIVAEGQTVSECCLLVSGYACRYKGLAAGTRQIVSFHVAGDILDIQHLLFDKADHSIEAITSAEIVFFPMNAARKLIEDHPAIRTALWRDCLVDASIFREWVLNVGRRDAKMRIAHMLCEFVVRCVSAGLGAPTEIELPMNQVHIADATGLTSIHVNRMIRALREEGLLTGSGRSVKVAEWEGLKAVAEFDPGYLHIAA